MNIRILIIAANPEDTPRIRVDEEIREIEKSLKFSKLNFQIKQQLASSVQDMRRAILELEPSILHFCGHGEGESGIAFEDHNHNGQTHLISSEALKGLFKLFSTKLECVILNACYSEVQAKAIATHIDYVIGMNNAIGDKPAIIFASAFYDAIGAGKSYEFAYQLGCNAIELEGIPEHLTPIFKTKNQTPVTTSNVYKSFENETVFLAEVTDDLHYQRLEVKNYLEQHNITVIPEKMYYFPNSESLIKTIDQDLNKCSLYIQLLNQTIPYRPEGMSTPFLQLERALNSKNIPILSWRSPELDLDEIKDTKVLELLNSKNVIATFLQDFKEIIIHRLKKLTMHEDPQQSEHDNHNFIFINSSSDPDDIMIAKKICEILKNNGLSSATPIFEDISPAEKRKDLEGNLTSCDAIIVLYVKSNIAWVREQLRQCQKIMRKRKDYPIKIVAIYDVPEDLNKPDLGMRFPNLEILECPNLNSENCLPKFLKKLAFS